MKAKDLYRAGSEHQHAHQRFMLGASSSFSLDNDPKHMVFVLARYKFVAKMLENKKRILEVGSGDGFGLPIVVQGAEKVYCIDWDKRHCDSIRERIVPRFHNIEVIEHDMNDKPANISVDAAYMIDVIEHIEPENEDRFLTNTFSSLPDDGVFICGTPNISAAQYACKESALQHINLKSMNSLRECMEKYFVNVFMFGMNDEVVHTGYSPMCHFIWALCAGLKKKSSARS